jgi:hypothetical protein
MKSIPENPEKVNVVLSGAQVTDVISGLSLFGRYRTGEAI